MTTKGSWLSSPRQPSDASTSLTDEVLLSNSHARRDAGCRHHRPNHVDVEDAGLSDHLLLRWEVSMARCTASDACLFPSLATFGYAAASIRTVRVGDVAPLPAEGLVQRYIYRVRQNKVAP